MAKKENTINRKHVAIAAAATALFAWSRMNSDRRREKASRALTNR